jgi:hypothetical protein
MKSVVLALGVCCGLLCCSQLMADDPKSSLRMEGEGTQVALIDIEYVFKNHARFKQQDVEAFDREVGEERKSLNTMKERRDAFSVGSPEYKRAEEEMARLMAGLQVRSQLKKKEMLEREAKVYYDTFMEITKEVAKLADQYGICLVLRFEGQELDPRDPNSVSAGLRRQVIYHRNLNLTPQVLERLNAVATRPAPNAIPGGASKTR